MAKPEALQGKDKYIFVRTFIKISYSSPNTPTESWVEVQEQQGETLSHTSSMKEMKELLASAASEEELSDSEQL